MNSAPVAQKVQEYFMSYIKRLIQSNQISVDLGNEIYQVGQNHLINIANDLSNKYRYAQIPLGDVESEAMNLVNSIVDSINQQQYTPYQNQIPNNLQGMNMGSHFSNQMSDPFNTESYSKPELFTDKREGGFNMNEIRETQEVSHLKNQELKQFEIAIKNDLKNSQVSVVPTIKNLKNGVDLNFDKKLYLQLNETDDVSYIKASLQRPYFKHKKVLDWLLNCEKMFFTSKNEKSIALIEMKTYRYQYFTGDNHEILRTLEKSKKNYNGYNKEFITNLINNSHRAVRIIEIIIVKRINQLLSLYLRSSENFSIRYEIENLDEIEDLLCLDLNKHNAVTEHQKFQSTVAKIINESMSWLFGKKDFSMSLLESVAEENLLRMISTDKIQMSDKDFIEYNYHSLNDDAKEKYLIELNKHNIFMIPEKMLITGYRDVKMLSRFGNDREIIIKNNESYFEVFLSFVSHNKKEMKPTFLCIKKKEDNEFVIFSVGLSLDGDLIVRRE